MKYICNNIFMVRTPSLPVDTFSAFMNFDGAKIEDFFSQNDLTNFIEKSVLIASRDLSMARERNLQQNNKKNKARELSFRKFFTRASTRPTPYGLFAGVALGEFSGNKVKAPLVIDERNAILECKVDFSWLSHFIYEMENNPIVYPQLQLRFNNNCYVSGDRLKNPHCSNHGFLISETIPTQRNHIRNTPLIAYIKQQAQSFISYPALLTRIQNVYPNVPREKIVSTINALMENEILLSNLRVPSNCENGLDYVLKILAPMEGIDRQKKALQKIDLLIKQMNGECSLDQINTETIESTYALMEDLIVRGKEKDLLSINKGLVLQKNKLSYEIKDHIEKFIEGLTYLQVNAPSQLETFKKRFQEEYGSNVEVPFCSIIDQNDFNGLSYLENPQPPRDEKDRKIKQIVDEKILYCLQSQGEEIFLYQNDFSSLGDIDDTKLPESFDVNFFITKENSRYRLWVAPIGGSGAAGDIFNRFGRVLDADLFHQYKENNRDMYDSDREQVMVEIRESCTSGRLSNVNNHENESQYYISLATNDDNSDAIELPLDDLLIGMQYDKVYVKSKRLGKRCKVRQNCMVNPAMLSEVSQLLMQISADQETSVIARAFQLFQNEYIFLPRISLEGVVVFPKRWNLSSHLFIHGSRESFEESFQMLRNKYEIDDIVYLTEMDNRLLLNLNKTYAIDILYKQFQKSESLRLSEVEKNILGENICVDTKGRRYITEISCSLIRTSTPNHILVKNDSINRMLQNENRPLLLLQDGWIYVKLYQIDNRENEVLQALLCYLNHIGNPKFFYLRYNDEAGRHLRIRFKYADELMAQKHLLGIQKMLTRFRDNKLINKVQFDTYFRENNRYGGSQLIAFAEEIFFTDSRFVIGLLDEFNIEETEEMEQAYLLGIISVLTAFFDRLEDMFDLVNQTPLLKENKKIFREKKQAYIKKIEQLTSRSYLGLSAQIRVLLIERDKTIKTYRDKIVNAGQKTDYLENIVAAVIHMFCNRLTGEKSLEHRYLNITREALSNIIEKKKRLPQTKL